MQWGIMNNLCVFGVSLPQDDLVQSTEFRYSLSTDTEDDQVWHIYHYQCQGRHLLQSILPCLCGCVVYTLYLNFIWIGEILLFPDTLLDITNALMANNIISDAIWLLSDHIFRAKMTKSDSVSLSGKTDILYKSPNLKFI